MIYTASYFAEEHHHGLLVPIAYGVSFNLTFGVTPVEQPLQFLIPQSSILKNWKYHRLSEKKYTEYYRVQMLENWQFIKNWLDRLSPQKDITLLSWELAGEFSHRNLVIKFIEKYRPDCYGGMDLKKKQRVLNRTI